MVMTMMILIMTAVNYFHWSNRVTVLVRELDIDQPWALLVVAVAFVVLSGLQEGLRCFRLSLAQQQLSADPKTRTPWSSLHLARSLLYVFEVSLSLCFMLMVMTFNLWILIAVVTGSALGWILCHVAFGGHQYETLLKVQQQQMNNKNGRPKSSHEPWQKQDQKAARTINNNVQNVESVQLIASV